MAQKEEHRDAQTDEPCYRRVKSADDLAIDLLVIPDRRQLDVRTREVRAAWLVAGGHGLGERSHAYAPPAVVGDGCVIFFK